MFVTHRTDAPPTLALFCFLRLTLPPPHSNTDYPRSFLVKHSLDAKHSSGGDVSADEDDGADDDDPDIVRLKTTLK